jgi:subtilisin-like proprotein convertase family protein
MKKILTLAAATVAVAAHATIYTTNWNTGFANDAAIPDNNLSGWSDTRTVSTMPAGTLAGLAVDLQLSSGWTGDLYAYLVNDTGFAVLLDRVGRPDAGSYGYGAGSMNVTLADGSSWNGNAILGNIHTAGATPAGIYYNPDNSAITSGSGTLGSFAGGPANGTWTLFVADLSGGGLTTVQSWGLQMDIVAVPEVETWVAAALAGMFGAFWLSRQIFGGVGKNVKS